MCIIWIKVSWRTAAVTVTGLFSLWWKSVRHCNLKKNHIHDWIKPALITGWRCFPCWSLVFYWASHRHRPPPTVDLSFSTALIHSRNMKWDRKAAAVCVFVFVICSLEAQLWYFPFTVSFNVTTHPADPHSKVKIRSLLFWHIFQPSYQRALLRFI